MNIGKMLKELIDLFDYKKPVIHVEKVKKGKRTPEGAVLDLLFFWDKKSEKQVLAQFFVSDSGVVAAVSTTHKESREVYSGSGSPKEVAVSVVTWLTNHSKTSLPSRD